MSLVLGVLDVARKEGTPFDGVPLSGLLVAGRDQVFRVFLEGTDPDAAVVEGVDALDGGGERLDRGQARYGAGDGRGADVVAVEAGRRCRTAC